MHDLDDMERFHVAAGAFTRMQEFSEGFPIGGTLGEVRFPASFIDVYTRRDGENLDPAEGQDSLVARWPTGSKVLTLNSIFSPYFIRDQTRTLCGANHPSETNRLPTGHVVIGDAYDDEGYPLILINLDEASTDYGKVYAWHLPGDLLSDNQVPEGLGYVADSLGAFLDGLSAKGDLLP